MSYAGPLDVRLVSRDSKKGLASAIMAGAEAASSEVIVVMDADLSHPPEVILQLVEPLVEKRCDMVIGSRYVQDGRITDWPLKRRIGSRELGFQRHRGTQELKKRREPENSLRRFFLFRR